VLQNQGLLGIAFFEATGLSILLVLFFTFRRDHPVSYFRLWLLGWFSLTLAAWFEVAQIIWQVPGLRVAEVLGHAVAVLLFVLSVIHMVWDTTRRDWPVFPCMGAIVAGIYYIESKGPQSFGALHWPTAIFESVALLTAGWLLWRAKLGRRGYGAQLLAGMLLACGLHGLDRPLWPEHPVFLLRVAFDHLLWVALGVAMVVMILERARSRTEELNDKLHRLTLLTAASTQTLSVQEVLDRVLRHLLESLNLTHGIVRLMEGEGIAAKLVARAAGGFSEAFLSQHHELSVTEPWVRQVLEKDCQFLRLEEVKDATARKKMAETGVQEIVTLALPGKSGPLGLIGVGSTRSAQFQPDEMSYLVNIANLLGLTLQNVRLFEQVATVQQQWAYTFDSIGDPILVHDRQGSILRGNHRLGELLGRDPRTLVGRTVSQLLPRKNENYKSCPYCEGMAGQGDEPDPWLQGYFLASNSTFTDPAGHELGTVHVLKDISDRKRVEEKYRTLVSNVQEGVFISTPQGRFLDFNDALLRMTGYDSREELLNLDIAALLFADSTERERLKKLLHEHGAVADFEFGMRRKDGEIRTMQESSIAVRDAAGNVTAYQGFLLDITERKRAEQEIRRRNRELMVLNSIARTLTESMDLGDSLHRTLRQMAELFSLDVSSLYLFDQDSFQLRRVAAVGQRTEFGRPFQPVSIQPELLQHIKGVHATFLSTQALALPSALREAQKKEGVVSAYVVILWSKGNVLGGLVVGSRCVREFSPADINLLIAVGSQISSAIERSVLYEETRQAYDNLRRTQEQLLNSEKMAAIGQLISGVAHELNNPLTAILGYSQLLISSGQIGPQGMEYSDKLYKQAQRTHRIVQNLLSFARQHKPERVPARINQILEETLALRDYDLRMSNIRVHLDLAADLPITAADPHQLQQVFLNMVNNAVDAMLEAATDGDLWVQTRADNEKLYIEFSDNGPGVQEASRVFDPFYTTKPVGKGTGLGLSICYGIITEHGGNIQVHNRPEGGASFTVELPFQRASQASPIEAGQAPISDRAALILLLDQDESVLEAVGDILRGHSHRVHTAKSSDEAITLIENHEFDLVVADLQAWEGTKGTSLREWVAAHKPLLTQRLIEMCAVAPSAVWVENGTERQRITLQKPFKAGELLTAVDAMLLSNIQPSPVER